MLLQYTRQYGAERIKNESEERRNIRLKDIPQREQSNMRLEDKRQHNLQATARKRE